MVYGILNSMLSEVIISRQAAFDRDSSIEGSPTGQGCVTLDPAKLEVIHEQGSWGQG